MADGNKLDPAFVSGFKRDDITWKRLRGNESFDYPIDYSIAVLGADVAKGKIDFLVKWEPNMYCHFHRHLGPTTVMVLEGEHHVVETTATETVHKTRTAGHVARNLGQDVHMEYGGPEGTVVLFSMQVPDGRLFEILDRQNNVLLTATIEDFVNGNLPG